MYIPFNEMPDQARVWIYQANRNITEAESLVIADALGKFTQGWQAHGADLQTSYQVMHNRFIVLAANQDFHAPSGCSIDSSVAVIRQIEQNLGLSLLDRSQVAYRNGDGAIHSVAVGKLKSEIIEKMTILPETTVFNNMVENIEQFKTKWEVPAQDTWLLRYFPVHML